MAAVINLHKFGIPPDDEGVHVFTFIFDNPQKIMELKSVESSEVSYAGHRWSLVCMRKEDRYMGFYLKWRYSDGQSAPAISCKAKYTLSMIHRHDYAENKYFASNQKFTTSQSLLGRSKFIGLSDLLDLSGGFLDETGKRVALELTMHKCTTRYERVIDTSPNMRTKKNVSGFYYDTTSFLLGSYRWYLRVYPQKLNSQGLPAVYLYLASKPKGLSIEINFRLYVGEDSTELLTYNYGEGAKFDGFGKTLSEPIQKVEKVKSLTIGVEIMSTSLWRDYILSLRSQNVYAPHLYNRDYRSSPYRTSPSIYGGRDGNSAGSFTPAEAFHDQEGNPWKIEVDRQSKRLMLSFDKAVHHYQQNKTKLLCWSITLVSRDPDRVSDLDMVGEAIVGYFSNFIDEKGYKVVFPIEFSELEEARNPFTLGTTDLMIRINFLSLQTVPLGMRSIPRFDYQSRHLLRARRMLQENSRNLADMREMAASRASLSNLLDTSTRDISDNDSMLSRSNSRVQLYKSYDSLDALETGDMLMEGHDGGKGFLSDLLRNLAIKDNNNIIGGDPQIDENSPIVTSRDLLSGTREDTSTESGVTVSDETSLLLEARPSPVDLGKQKEVVATLVKFLKQRLPMRVTEVLEFGSVGSGTLTRSRMDVDLVIFSPDLPASGQAQWMPSLLASTLNFLQHAASSPDPFFPLPKCSYFATTPLAVQLTCGGVDVDIMFSHDWEADDNGQGGYPALYNQSIKQTTLRGRRWNALASSRLAKKFIAGQPNEVKEIVKVVKHWRNTTTWKKPQYRPPSYLLNLLVVKAVEDTKSTDIKRVLQRFGALVLTPELSIQWSMYYVPEKYHCEFEPPTPMVRDPSNPGFNVAETLSYWGQFRTELIVWLKSLGVSIVDTII